MENNALINLFEHWHGANAQDLLSDLKAGKRMNRQTLTDVLQVYIEIRDYIRTYIGDGEFALMMADWQRAQDESEA